MHQCIQQDFIYFASLTLLSSLSSSSYPSLPLPALPSTHPPSSPSLVFKVHLSLSFLLFFPFPPCLFLPSPPSFSPFLSTLHFPFYHSLSLTISYFLISFLHFTRCLSLPSIPPFLLSSFYSDTLTRSITLPPHLSLAYLSLSSLPFSSSLSP